MPDQKSDKNEVDEEIAEIIAESPPEEAIKSPKSSKKGGIGKWMDKIASLIIRAILFGVIAGGVGVAIIWIVPQQFLPNAISPETQENSRLLGESVAEITEKVEGLQSSIIPELEIRIEGLEEGVTQFGSNLQASNNQNTSLSSELITINEAVGAQSEQLIDLEANLEDLAIKQGTLRDELETTLIALEESVGEIGSSLAAVEAENMDLQEDLIDLTFSMSMRTNTGGIGNQATGKPGISSSENNLPVGTNGQLVLLESRLLRLGEKIQEIDTLARSVANLGEEVSELRTELTSIGTGQGAMNELDGEIQRISTQLPGLEVELNNLNDRNQTLVDQIERLQDNAAQMEMQIASLSSLTMGENSLRNLTLIGIQAAVEAGIPYAAIIGEDEINNMELPAIILELSEEGVATLVELQNEFEELIAEALKAVETGAEAGSIQDMARSIVTSLVQVRSLTPREGDDAVAVLSRLEESLNKGNLGSVLALYAQLPPPVQESLALWKLKVQNRLDLIEALEMSFSNPAFRTGR